MKENKSVWILVILLALTLARPVSVLAALSELPLGDTNRIVEFVLKDIDSMGFILRSLDNTTEGDLFNKAYSWYEWEDGRKETFNELARRSPEDLARVTATILRAVVKDVFERSVKGEIRKINGGERFRLSYVGFTKTTPSNFFFPILAGRNPFAAVQETGGLSAPEEAFKVDFTLAVTGLFYFNVRYPGVESATISQEDEWGNVVSTTEGRQSAKYDVISIPMSLALSPTFGVIRIKERDGIEQVLDLYNGSELIRYPSSKPVPAGSKRLGLPRFVSGGLVIPYEARDEEIVSIEVSEDLKSWGPLQDPTVKVHQRQGVASPTAVRVRTAYATAEEAGKFFRARVNP